MKDRTIKSRHKGFLIAFEGISGCGKSECIKEIFEYFSRRDYPVKVVEWNSNKVLRWISKRLHSCRLLSPGLYSTIQWLGFLLDYFIKIRPLMSEGYIVLADRYVYTGLTRDAANRAGTFLGNIVFHIVRKPDGLFFLDVPPKLCYERIKKRGKTLFHTNKKIHRNPLLRNKDLCYLIKIKNEYRKLLKTRKVREGTKLYFVTDTNSAVCRLVGTLVDPGRNAEYDRADIGHSYSLVAEEGNYSYQKGSEKKSTFERDDKNLA